jgi:hypothetical protein
MKCVRQITLCYSCWRREQATVTEVWCCSGFRSCSRQGKHECLGRVLERTNLAVVWVVFSCFPAAVKFQFMLC